MALECPAFTPVRFGPEVSLPADVQIEHSDSSRPKPHGLRYRPEIDGLRAVAVLVVVFFHARLLCKGGFVGVDVFFVISGFLITSLIVRAIDDCEFSMLDFWERRIRRIAPALIVTVLTTLIVAWFLYLPDDLDRLGGAVMSQIMISGNIYHWMASGYFGPDASELPLLHTWSLAVEEQFYVLFPVVLFLIAAWRRAWLGRACILASAFSFGLGVWATPKYPDAAFYLLPTRAWELLLGSLMAVYPSWGKSASGFLREAISIAGLAAIGISVALYTEATPFPGMHAALPCLGTAAFIWSNRLNLTLGGRLLACRPIVFVGQISYSVYLLHWPVLVFAFYVFDVGTWRWRLGLVTMIFVLALLCWMMVETPVRKKWIFARRRTLFSVTASSFLLLLTCGALLQLNGGFPSRFESVAMKYAASRNEREFRSQLSLSDAERGAFPQIGMPDGPMKCLVWGDSHAMAMIPPIDRLCRENGYSAFAATRSATAPLLGFARLTNDDDTTKINDAVLTAVVDRGIKNVILAARWSKYSGDNRFHESLAETVETLTSRGITVYIVLDVPIQKWNVPRKLALDVCYRRDVTKEGISVSEHRKANKQADTCIERLASSNVVILDPTPYFLDGTGLCRAEFNGVSMYHDSNHLSTAGALRVKDLFNAVFLERP